MPSLSFPIETERLLLRTYEPEDVDAIHAYHGLDEVARFHFWEARTREQVAEKLVDWAKMDGAGPESDGVALVIVRKSDNLLIGDTGIAVRDRAARQGEIGFSMHPEASGQGYATEAALKLIEIGFEHLGLHRVYGRCDARNDGSWKLMERLGMRREAHFREHAIFKGGWDEEFYYAILEDEWRAQHANGTSKPHPSAA